MVLQLFVQTYHRLLSAFGTSITNAYSTHFVKSSGLNAKQSLALESHNKNMWAGGGKGVAIIAANACADYLSMFAVSTSLQCVWVRCDKALFGFGEDVMLCAVYTDPQSQAFTLAHVTNSFSFLFDELACGWLLIFCCVAA